jgi:hypothetical protein
MWNKVSCWNKWIVFGFLCCTVAQAHVVSISNGELHVTGRSATFELRIPAYEVEAIANPETALLNEIRFAGATRQSAGCRKDADWLTCSANYEFAEPVPDKIEVECTLYRVTVPNHIHMLYAVQGGNSDQQVFDQNTSMREMRFHPPSIWESIVRDGGAGALRLLKSPAGLLFLFVVALAARSVRDAALLVAMFFAAEWIVRPISPFIPLSLSPEFLEAVMALTAGYLAGELLFLPDGSARWGIVPLLGLVHGLPFVAFPPLYLGGAMLVQAILFGAIAFAILRLPAQWRKRSAAIGLVAACGWFAYLVLA